VRAEPTLRERRKQETNKLILDTAIHEFATQGYGQTTVDAIVTAAGISKGAFYHHFAGKEDLFKALLEDRQRRCIEQMQQAVAPATSVREAIERLVTASFEFCQDDPDWVRLYFEFCMQATRDRFARKIVADALEECRRLVAGMLQAAPKTIVRADLDIDAAAVLLTSLFDGISLHWAVDGRSTDLKMLAGPTADLIERFVSEPGNR